MKSLFAVGITGGIATGKSETLRILKTLGVTTLSADTLAHDCLRTGHPVYRKVLARYGQAILDQKGHIQRHVLGGYVFQNAKERRWLESLVHPCVIREIKRFLRNHQGLVMVEVPLLYEARLEQLFDVIVVVSTSQRLQLERLHQKGLSRTAALRRIRAQWPLDRKRRLANIVIQNDQKRSDLKRIVSALVRKWRAAVKA